MANEISYTFRAYILELINKGCKVTEEEIALKRTYQPKRRRHKRVHGFLRRMRTRAGQNVLRRRRRKERERLSA